MLRQIILSLLIITTLSTYGMEPGHAIPMELVLSDHNIMQHITTQICDVNAWQPENTRKDIQSLATVNKLLRRYYGHENTGKNIIRSMALYHNTSDSCTASFFRYKKISAKMGKLFDVVERINGLYFFTKKHKKILKDAWYLNATQSYGCINDLQQDTLLLVAIKNLQLKNVKALISAGINCNSHRSGNPIALMSSMRYVNLAKDKRQSFFSIVRLLLNKGIRPDSRYNTAESLLHQAVYCNNQRFARTLLRHGADPNIQQFVLINNTIYRPKNAFDLEQGEPKGWLQALVDEIKQEKTQTTK